MNPLVKTFECTHCDYSCGKLSEWKKHTLTRKHLFNIIEHKKSPMKYICDICNKDYSSRSSLWYHSKKCKAIEIIEQKKSPIEQQKSPHHDIEIKYADLVNRLLNDNQRILSDNVELRNFIVEQSKITAELMTRTIDKVMEQNTEVITKALESNKNTSIVNNNTNNSNNKFNINLFLNEQCKDAFNFTEFVKNIEISYQDLENNAQLGFVQGISKIFMDNLKQLGVNERPIHCTDIKRETMYIKDEDKWNKEVDDSKLQKAIQTVSYKSMGKLMEWKQENPDYQDADSEFSKRCLDIQRQSLAGSERETYYPKVIHILAKETMVDK
jgi:hypothetical protein